VTKNGEPKVENRLLKQVKDIYRKLRLKLSALLSTPQQPKPKEQVKPEENSL
jgi:hypothetical protein